MNNIKLKKHQILPIDFIKHNFGLILFHSTGSGKTITALTALYQFPNDIIIIGPKSSKKAFYDEINKLEYNKEKFSFYTYHKIKKLLIEDIDFLSNKSVILDEAHHIRNDTRDNIFIANALTIAFRVLLLTATPIVNYLNDIAPLVNIIKKSDTLPTERELFNFFYFDENNLQITNQDLIKDKLNNCISYYEKKDDLDYPKSNTYYNKIIMNKDQINEYSNYIVKIVFNNEKPINKNVIDAFDINTDFLNNRMKNSFLTATRQISNCSIDDSSNSPKILKIVDTIIQHDFPVVVYSNFLKRGIYPVANLLDKKNISYKMITGSTNNEKIDSIINNYNRGLFQVLLLSSAGSESLDLKNTRQIHIMEPHWNESKIRQVIGRAVRYKSHQSLPVKDRNVSIFRWVSKFPDIYTNISADEYLADVSIKKDLIFKKFKDIIIESSIENSKKIIKGGSYHRSFLNNLQKYLINKYDSINNN